MMKDKRLSELSNREASSDHGEDKPKTISRISSGRRPDSARGDKQFNIKTNNA